MYSLSDPCGQSLTEFLCQLSSIRIGVIRVVLDFKHDVQLLRLQQRLTKGPTISRADDTLIIIADRKTATEAGRF